MFNGHQSSIIFCTFSYMSICIPTIYLLILTAVCMIWADVRFWHYFFLCTLKWTNWKIEMFIIDNNAQTVQKIQCKKKGKNIIPIWEETILNNFIIIIYKTSFVAAIKVGTKIKLTDRTSYEVILHILKSDTKKNRLRLIYVRCDIRKIIFYLHWYIRYNDIKI